jgi:hypothetical protein
MAKVYPLHQQLVMSGTIAGGDVWSCSLHTIWGPLPGLQMSKADQDLYLDKDGQLVETINGLVSSWWNPAAANYKPASVFSLDSVKFNSIGHDGKYVFNDTTEWVLNPPQVGGSAVGRSPRDTICVTLRAGYQRGLAAFGRYYPPMNQINPDAGSPYFAVALAEGYRDLQLALINGLNGLPARSGETLTVVNISPGVDLSAAVVTPVTRVEVDRVIDTQRRRTNRVPRLTVTGAVS